jgi:RNA 2',3'-cyclic 3'-phosphodiesterase
MTDRLFLGIPLTPAATAELSAYLERTFSDGVPGRVVPAENWHLTVRFLGDLAPEACARLRGAIGAGGLGHPFEIRLGSVGAFPTPHRARVLWIGVTEGEPRLVSLAEAVERRVGRAGLSIEERPYSPHLTIARLREPADLSGRLRSTAPPAVSFAVSEVVLFRSQLGGGPPRYAVVERFPL